MCSKLALLGEVLDTLCSLWNHRRHQTVVPSEFSYLKHHRPAQNPKSAQGYRVSCSLEVGGGPEEAKPFIWNQSPEICWSGRSKIQPILNRVWCEWCCWARFWANPPISESSYKQRTCVTWGHQPGTTTMSCFQVWLDTLMTFHYPLHHPTVETYQNQDCSKEYVNSQKREIKTKLIDRRWLFLRKAFPLCLAWHGGWEQIHQNCNLEWSK